MSARIPILAADLQHLTLEASTWQTAMARGQDMDVCLSKGRLSVSEEASRYVSSWSPTKDTRSPFARPIAFGNVLGEAQATPRLAASSYCPVVGDDEQHSRSSVVEAFMDMRESFLCHQMEQKGRQRLPGGLQLSGQADLAGGTAIV